MITQFQVKLCPDRLCSVRPEWGYRLYAALLEQAGEPFGSTVHRDAVTPISQFLTVESDAVTWTVNLLGAESEQSLSGLLEKQQTIWLKKDRVRVQIADCRVDAIRDVEELFARAAGQDGDHVLHVQTPAAFKSQGEYLNLPTSRLLVQSLIRKWNGCFPDCPIEDEDGQGMEAIAAGLRCRRFELRDQAYHLKGHAIPGFVGELTVENRLTGFHRELADVLLLFSGYAGVGIKTALGMGGVVHRRTVRKQKSR